ncbi:MAG TPA: hypothetical protein VNN74_10510 [Candidatus Micrarchaeia archaeon]|nr:hypothetical protein [Candidatus Micrarchaeia archaeon]
MAAIRIVEGVDPEDRVAFGLPAPRLLVAATGLVLAIACGSSPLPAALRGTLAVLIAAAASVLAWGRVGGRPLLAWTPLVAGFALQRWQRRQPPLPFAGDRRDERGQAVPTAAARVVGRPDRADDAQTPVIGGARRIVFFSLEGGVGRTTLATEVAAMQARPGRVRTASGRSVPPRVAVVDLDLDAGGVGERLGLSGPSLADLLAPGPVGPQRMRRTLVRHRESGLMALLAPPAPMAVSGDLLGARAVDLLRALDGTGLDAVVVDLGPGLTPLTRPVLAAAHDIVVVLTPSTSLPRDASRAQDALASLPVRGRVHLVCNRVASGWRTDAAVRAVSASLTASIASDPRFDGAERSHVPTSVSAHGPAPDGLAQLAAALRPEAPAAARRAPLVAAAP